MWDLFPHIQINHMLTGPPTGCKVLKVGFSAASELVIPYLCLPLPTSLPMTGYLRLATYDWLPLTST